jgi:hypothetical protein
MPAIFSSQDSATIGMLRAMLIDEGIPCEVRNEASHALLGEVAFAGLVVPEIWVIHERDRERAKELVFAFLNAPATGSATRPKSSGWTRPGPPPPAPRGSSGPTEASGTWRPSR